MLRKITTLTFTELKDIVKRNKKLNEMAAEEAYNTMNAFVNDYISFVENECIFKRERTSIYDFRVLEYRSFFYGILECDKVNDILYDTAFGDEIKFVKAWFEENAGYNEAVVRTIDEIAEWFCGMLNHEYDDIDNIEFATYVFSNAVENNLSELYDYDHIYVDTETAKAYIPFN